MRAGRRAFRLLGVSYVSSPCGPFEPYTYKHAHIQNSAHQYDYDAQTVMAFLRTYGLEKDFKINIEPNHTTLAGHAPEHDILLAAQYGMLGSIDANTGTGTCLPVVPCLPALQHTTSIADGHVSCSTYLRHPPHGPRNQATRPWAGIRTTS